MPFTIVFDLDDTLVPAGHLYREAIWKCGAIITRALRPRSPSARRLLEYQERLDAELMAVLGYSNERFPEGWVQTYRHFCTAAGMEPDPLCEHQIRRAAMLFMIGAFDAAPFARTVLGELRAQQHRMHVVTRGNQELQERKLLQSGLRSFFSTVVVVPIGSKHEALRTLMVQEPGPWVMIGDGRRSDIRPAIEVGMHAVWLRGGDPWEHLDEELDPRLHYTIDSLGEIPALLERISDESV